MRTKQHAFDPIKVGDRVRFVDENAVAYAKIIGQAGTVVSIASHGLPSFEIPQAADCHDILNVRFDSGILSSAYVHRFKLVGNRMSVDILF